MIKVKEEGYLHFIYEGLKNQFHFFNKDGVAIGWLDLTKVGRWSSWVYFLHKDCYLSASCSDEVREAQRRLNANGSLIKVKK